MTHENDVTKGAKIFSYSPCSYPWRRLQRDLALTPVFVYIKDHHLAIFFSFPANSSSQQPQFSYHFAIPNKQLHAIKKGEDEEPQKTKIVRIQLPSPAHDDCQMVLRCSCSVGAI
ncbi:hypothetical protein BC937DRAFT_93649 [Endogone sp. FLAS-F59071]|nr:hypothetical protein BC937DRAFT_93649 [Endogone sp. FLAS-F59071]|eukprot:RUS14550.1 hypothetical protein BC937DRAFT_93649 [Endogone sp. FLAS-F59071]